MPQSTLNGKKQAWPHSRSHNRDQWSYSKPKRVPFDSQNQQGCVWGHAELNLHIKKVKRGSFDTSQVNTTKLGNARLPKWSRST